MAVMLDTASMPAADRYDAFRTGLLEASGSTRVDLDTPPAGVWGRMSLWSFGTCRVFTAESSGQTMVRDARAARGASPEAVAVAVHGLGRGRHRTAHGDRVVRGGDLMVVDVTRPFDFAWNGPGSSTSLQVPIAELDLPVATVQRAADRLEASPLYDLFSRHLVALTRDADRLSSSAAAATLGAASAQLVRALLSGAADDAPDAEVLEQTLLAQVLEHVRQHLRDPGLTPDSVARALSVSRRQLFRVCTRAEISLEQHIISRRLEGARAELRTTVGRSRTIAAVAAGWGFKDPTHFARRFRAAYGMRPQEWRRLAVEDPAAGALGDGDRPTR
jgi:AraC-like DNA-binding protein